MGLKQLIILFLMIFSNLIPAQSKNNLELKLDITPFFEKLILHIHSKNDSITNCFIQIKDAKQVIVRSNKLPPAYKHLDYKLDIIDLLPGKYTCEVLSGTTSIFHKDFNKDAILSEPQTQPVIRKD